MKIILRQVPIGQANPPQSHVSFERSFLETQDTPWANVFAQLSIGETVKLEKLNPKDKSPFKHMNAITLKVLNVRSRIYFPKGSDSPKRLITAVEFEYVHGPHHTSDGIYEGFVKNGWQTL